MHAILVAVALAIAVVTVLPIFRGHRWWIRLCDFPRFQVAVLGTGVLIVLCATRWPLTTGDGLVFIAVALSVIWQASWVWRYVRGAPLEVQTDRVAAGQPERIDLLTTNVFQKSRDSNSLLKIVTEADPDVVLAVETDEWWCSRLTDGLGSRYPHSLLYPLSNGYGLAVFSRLELREPVVRFLVDDAIPSIKTGVRLRCGVVIDLYGIHPQPPAPLQDSIERDVELVLVGKETKRSPRPAIVLGDLNDVAWSSTTTRFKTAGGLLDQRRGRGFFNTYPAGLPGLRYPLDYIFHTPHFAVCDMRVLPRFASDHLPFVAALSLTNLDGQPAGVSDPASVSN
jgi:endonuclease/exonuclease/phosphatase (EEP) superfamily protein YafD